MTKPDSRGPIEAAFINAAGVIWAEVGRMQMRIDDLEREVKGERAALVRMENENARLRQELDVARRLRKVG